MSCSPNRHLHLVPYFIMLLLWLLLRPEEPEMELFNTKHRESFQLYEMWFLSNAWRLLDNVCFIKKKKDLRAGKKEIKARAVQLSGLTGLTADWTVRQSREGQIKEKDGAGWSGGGWVEWWMTGAVDDDGCRLALCSLTVTERQSKMIDDTSTSSDELIEQKSMNWQHEECTNEWIGEMKLLQPSACSWTLFSLSISWLVLRLIATTAMTVMSSPVCLLVCPPNLDGGCVSAQIRPPGGDPGTFFTIVRVFSPTQ